MPDPVHPERSFRRPFPLATAGERSKLLLPAGITHEQLENALVVCEGIAARDLSSLYLTSQFFADPSRYHAFVAMYAIMRVIDDIIDQVPQEARLSIEVRTGLETGLDSWERRIRGACDGRPSDQALDIALAAAVLTFPVPMRLWVDFIDAMRFDVRHSRFSDFAEFLAYAKGATVAPTAIYVFLLTSKKDPRTGCYMVDGFDFESCGHELGVFAYLTHILRDVARDMRAGLVYLSRQDLARHHLSEETLRALIEAGADDDRWRRLVQDICGRARAMEVLGTRMAEKQYDHMPRDCVFILSLIINIYSDLLRRIEAAPAEVLHGDAVRTMPDRALLLAVAQQIGYPPPHVLEEVSRVSLELS